MLPSIRTPDPDSLNSVVLVSQWGNWNRTANRSVLLLARSNRTRLTHFISCRTQQRTPRDVQFRPHVCSRFLGSSGSLCQSIRLIPDLLSRPHAAVVRPIEFWERLGIPFEPRPKPGDKCEYPTPPNLLRESVYPVSSAVRGPRADLLEFTVSTGEWMAAAREARRERIASKAAKRRAAGAGEVKKKAKPKAKVCRLCSAVSGDPPGARRSKSLQRATADH